MAKDIQGVGLGIASRFAGSEFARKFGLRKPAEKLAYAGTKKGFEVIGQMVAKKAAKKAMHRFFCLSQASTACSI